MRAARRVRRIAWSRINSLLPRTRRRSGRHASPFLVVDVGRRFVRADVW